MLPSLNELTQMLISVVDGILSNGVSLASREKRDGSLVTAVDEALQTALTGALAQRWQQFPLLGEEMDVAEQRRLLDEHAGGVWCLDPLDGTTNFATGLPFYSVSLALMVNGRAVLGVVYDPQRRECFSAAAGEGAWLDGKSLSLMEDAAVLRDCVGVVDFKRLDKALAARLAQAGPYRSQRNLGSCALEWCWLAAGRAQLYLHGGMKLWDYAAGSLILAEAGGHSCTLDGEAVEVPEVIPRSVVAAADAGLFRQWREWLGVPGTA